MREHFKHSEELNQSPYQELRGRIVWQRTILEQKATIEATCGYLDPRLKYLTTAMEANENRLKVLDTKFKASS